VSSLHQKSHIAAQLEPRKTRWLALLEQELKSRVGWTNEAISPFGRRHRPVAAKPKLRRAA
jgi:hypothetical protein